MKVEKIEVGSLKTNCYIISNNQKCIVIDPGDEYEKISKVIGNEKIVGTIVTHYHFDHIGALNYFNKVYDYSNLKEGINKLDDFSFEVINTSGHTNDSISIYFKKINMMFVGDFLFKDGIGRTDLGGNIEDMKKSLIKMKKYPRDIIIMPGHGESSYLGKELDKWI